MNPTARRRNPTSLRKVDARFTRTLPVSTHARPLCPQCLAELPQRVAFCPKCNVPVGPFATYDPIQQIYSTGWFYRRAIGGGISTIACLGK